MKIIFLDVDGVLMNNVSWTRAYNTKKRELPDEAAIAELNRVVEETGAYVVMSSSWRVGLTVTEIRELLLGWGVVCKVLDKTPRLSFRTVREAIRGEEIQEWLNVYKQTEGYGPVESFVILDDESDMAHLKSHLVQTWVDDGLTKEKADEAIAMLKRCLECGGTNGKHVGVFQREFTYSEGFGEVAGHYQKCTRDK